MKSCEICDSNDWEIAYQGPIRLGEINNISRDDYTVYRCKNCTVQWLPNLISKKNHYYESDEYRNTVGESCNIKDYEKKHDGEIQFQFELYPLPLYRDKVIADIGCGGGLFLDSVKGFAKKTIAVEPNNQLLVQLHDKGHQCFSNIEELLNSNDNGVDLIVSHSVIEHVSHPVNFVESLKKAVRNNGTLIVSTPNAQDFLLTNGPSEYKMFFYRMVHEWYFNEKSLEIALKRVGFSEIQIKYQHMYSLTNALLWMRDKKGYGRLDILNDESCNFMWKQFLMKTGQAERLVCIAS